MDNIEYLFAGFAVFWGGLFVYLLLLQARLRALTHEIERLEERLAEADGGVMPSTSPGLSPGSGRVERPERTESAGRPGREAAERGA